MIKIIIIKKFYCILFYITERSREPESGTMPSRAEVEFIYRSQSVQHQHEKDQGNVINFELKHVLSKLLNANMFDICLVLSGISIRAGRLQKKNPIILYISILKIMNNGNF